MSSVVQYIIASIVVVVVIMLAVVACFFQKICQCVTEMIDDCGCNV